MAAYPYLGPVAHRAKGRLQAYYFWTCEAVWWSQDLRSPVPALGLLVKITQSERTTFWPVTGNRWPKPLDVHLITSLLKVLNNLSGDFGSPKLLPGPVPGKM